MFEISVEFESMRKKKTILVAEDEVYNYFLIEEILSGPEYEIVWAQDGQIAVDMFKSRCDIDLILMDIKMPNLSGIEAMKIIKVINNSVPIIAQTAFAFEEGRLMQYGFDDYITKPMNIDKLLRKVESWIPNNLQPKEIE